VALYFWTASVGDGTGLIRLLMRTAVKTQVVIGSGCGTTFPSGLRGSMRIGNRPASLSGWWLSCRVNAEAHSPIQNPGHGPTLVLVNDGADCFHHFPRTMRGTSAIKSSAAYHRWASSVSGSK